MIRGTFPSRDPGRASAGGSPLWVQLPVLLPLWLLLAAAGCALQQAAPLKHSFLLEASRPEPSPAGRGGGVLRVHEMQVAAPFDGRAFVYRRGPLDYEADFYDEFLVAPHALLTQQVRNWLSGSGLFAFVLEPRSRSDATWGLEGTVTTLHGDFRDRRAPKAILAMRFVLTEERAVSGGPLAQRVYREEIELAQATPQALAAGWSLALSRILARLEHDLFKLSRK